jgi:hypothetical protein
MNNIVFNIRYRLLFISLYLSPPNRFSKTNDTKSIESNYSTSINSTFNNSSSNINSDITPVYNNITGNNSSSNTEYNNTIPYNGSTNINSDITPIYSNITGNNSSSNINGTINITNIIFPETPYNIFNLTGLNENSTDLQYFKEYLYEFLSQGSIVHPNILYQEKETLNRRFFNLPQLEPNILCDNTSYLFATYLQKKPFKGLTLLIEDQKVSFNNFFNIFNEYILNGLNKKSFVPLNMKDINNMKEFFVSMESSKFLNQTSLQEYQQKINAISKYTEYIFASMQGNTLFGFFDQNHQWNFFSFYNKVLQNIKILEKISELPSNHMINNDEVIRSIYNHFVYKEPTLLCLNEKSSVSMFENMLFFQLSKKDIIKEGLFKKGSLLFFQDKLMDFNNKLGDSGVIQFFKSPLSIDNISFEDLAQCSFFDIKNNNKGSECFPFGTIKKDNNDNYLYKNFPSSNILNNQSNYTKTILSTNSTKMLYNSACQNFQTNDFSLLNLIDSYTLALKTGFPNINILEKDILLSLQSEQQYMFNNFLKNYITGFVKLKKKTQKNVLFNMRSLYYKDSSVMNMTDNDFLTYFNRQNNNNKTEFLKENFINLFILLQRENSTDASVLFLDSLRDVNDQASLYFHTSSFNVLINKKNLNSFFSDLTTYLSSISSFPSYLIGLKNIFLSRQELSIGDYNSCGGQFCTGWYSDIKGTLVSKNSDKVVTCGEAFCKNAPSSLYFSCNGCVSIKSGLGFLVNTIVLKNIETETNTKTLENLKNFQKICPYEEICIGIPYNKPTLNGINNPTDINSATMCFQPILLGENPMFFGSIRPFNITKIFNSFLYSDKIFEPIGIFFDSFNNGSLLAPCLKKNNNIEDCSGCIPFSRYNYFSQGSSNTQCGTFSYCSNNIDSIICKKTFDISDNSNFCLAPNDKYFDIYLNSLNRPLKRDIYNNSQNQEKFCISYDDKSFYTNGQKSITSYITSCIERVSQFFISSIKEYPLLSFDYSLWQGKNNSIPTNRHFVKSNDFLISLFVPDPNNGCQKISCGEGEFATINKECCDSSRFLQDNTCSIGDFTELYRGMLRSKEGLCPFKQTVKRQTYKDKIDTFCIWPSNTLNSSNIFNIIYPVLEQNQNITEKGFIQVPKYPCLVDRVLSSFNGCVDETQHLNEFSKNLSDILHIRSLCDENVTLKKNDILLPIQINKIKNIKLNNYLTCIENKVFSESINTDSKTLVVDSPKVTNYCKIQNTNTVKDIYDNSLGTCFNNNSTCDNIMLITDLSTDPLLKIKFPDLAKIIQYFFPKGTELYTNVVKDIIVKNITTTISEYNGGGVMIIDNINAPRIASSLCKKIPSYELSNCILLVFDNLILKPNSGGISLKSGFEFSTTSNFLSKYKNATRGVFIENILGVQNPCEAGGIMGCQGCISMDSYVNSLSGAQLKSPTPTQSYILASTNCGVRNVCPSLLFVSGGKVDFSTLPCPKKRFLESKLFSNRISYNEEKKLFSILLEDDLSNEKERNLITDSLTKNVNVTVNNNSTFDFNISMVDSPECMTFDTQFYYDLYPNSNCGPASGSINNNNKIPQSVCDYTKQCTGCMKDIDINKYNIKIKPSVLFDSFKQPLTQPCGVNNSCIGIIVDGICLQKLTDNMIIYFNTTDGSIEKDTRASKYLENGCGTSNFKVSKTSFGNQCINLSHEQNPCFDSSDLNKKCNGFISFILKTRYTTSKKISPIMGMFQESFSLSCYSDELIKVDLSKYQIIGCTYKQDISMESLFKDSSPLNVNSVMAIEMGGSSYINREVFGGCAQKNPSRFMNSCDNLKDIDICQRPKKYFYQTSGSDYVCAGNLIIIENSKFQNYDTSLNNGDVEGVDGVKTIINLALSVSSNIIGCPFIGGDQNQLFDTSKYKVIACQSNGWTGAYSQGRRLFNTQNLKIDSDLNILHYNDSLDNIIINTEYINSTREAYNTSFNTIDYDNNSYINQSNSTFNTDNMLSFFQNNTKNGSSVLSPLLTTILTISSILFYKFF